MSSGSSGIRTMLLRKEIILIVINQQEGFIYSPVTKLVYILVNQLHVHWIFIFSSFATFTTLSSTKLPLISAVTRRGKGHSVDSRLKISFYYPKITENPTGSLFTSTTSEPRRNGRSKTVHVEDLSLLTVDLFLFLLHQQTSRTVGGV